MQGLLSGFPGRQTPQARLDGPKLDMETGKGFQIYGDRNNTQVVFQNRRLYLANGRMLQQDDLADDTFHMVPVELRQAVAADMEKPVAPPQAPGAPKRQLTPEELLDAMETFTEGPVRRYTEHKARGVIIRNEIPGLLG